MIKAIVLRQRVRTDIQSQTTKVLRELGYPEPPLRLEDVRELLRLDRSYFTSEQDGILSSVASKLRRGGKQILLRPTLLFDAIKKFDLRALYLPDEKRILIDDSVPKPKQRWLETHEIGHDILPWHGDVMMGDDDITPTARTHDRIEAEANFAAGSLLFLGDKFREEVLQLEATIANVQRLGKRYGNTITTTLWRLIEYAGEQTPIIGAIGVHPSKNEPIAFRHIVPSPAFDRMFPTPTPDDLLRIMRSYCVKNRGPLGRGEIALIDINGDRHAFEFETFYNGYDALTLGVYRGKMSNAIIGL